jgi:hypothetical protein
MEKMDYNSEYPDLGQWQISDAERKRRMEKALEHERGFGQKQDTDIIKKRMDSDLFKGGLR